MKLGVFTDTFDEVKRQAQPTDEASQAGGAWHEFRGRARHRTETPRSMLEYMLQDEDIQNHEAEMLGEIYNPKEAGSFRAFIHGNKHSDLRFFVEKRGAMPYMPSPEEVALIDFDPGGSQDGIWYLTHFAQEWKDGIARSTENRHTVAAQHYRIETAIGKNDHLSATCVLQLKARHRLRIAPSPARHPRHLQAKGNLLHTGKPQRRWILLCDHARSIGRGPEL